MMEEYNYRFLSLRSWKGITPLTDLVFALCFYFFQGMEMFLSSNRPDLSVLTDLLSRGNLIRNVKSGVGR